MTIPIITRTNTIDEWRIQTNLSAEKLNDLETGDFDKTDGTLTISGDSTLIITAEGTPLQISNSALIQKDLTLGSNLTVGLVGSRTGNVTVGNTVIVAGQGVGLYVSNTAQLGNLTVIGTAFANNATVNTNAVVGNDVLVGGIVSLSGSGKVIDANNGIVYIKDAYLSNATLQRANVDSIYALEATIDNLKDIASAVIGILRVATGNIYVLSSNTMYANSGIIQNFVANSTGNIVNFTSNVATINTGYILNLTSDDALIYDANVLTLLANTSTLNTSILVNTTVTNAAISNAVITTATIGNLSATNGTITTGTIINGNVVTLTSNSATINNSTLLSSNLVSTNITNGNVSGNLNFTNGSLLRLNSGAGNNAIIVDTGVSTLRSTVVEGNLTVTGTFTQTGNLNFEIDRFLLNANTTENKDATIINERVSGNDSIILWNESNDRWEISTGNNWTQTYKILDGADIYTGVDSDSQTRVASASAVKFAYEAGGVIAGGYANAAYRHANSSFVSQNTTGVYANTGYAHANSAHDVANSAFSGVSGTHANAAYRHANSSYDHANTANVSAQAAFDAANNAFAAGGQFAYRHANSAYDKANSAFAGTTGTHANSAYFTANTALTNAEIAQQKAIEANTRASLANVHANAAYNFGNTINNFAFHSYTHANAAFATANTKLSSTGGTVTGDVTITGSLTVAGSGAVINANDLRIGDAIITLNSDVLPEAPPIENSGIEINRGRDPAVRLLWNETSNRWEFTNDGDNYQAIMGSADLSGYLLRSGGTMTGSLTMGTGTVLTLAQDPQTGTQAATKNYVDARLASTSGLPSQTGQNGRFLRTDGTNAYWHQFSTSDSAYSLNILGNAATATRATTADGPTAGTNIPWPNATNATNVSGGGSVSCSTFSVSSSFYCGTTATFQGGMNVYGNIDASGRTITASFFDGTAARARYADLAEKYLADDEYIEGTLLSVGGEKEVTASTIANFKVLGVVSSKPAYLMNADLEGGTIVALKGRVPVRVTGKIKKGDPLGASNLPGIGQVNFDKYFALSLNDKNTDEEGTVEAIIL